MPQLAIVDAPALHGVAEGPLQVNVGPADPYFEELALVDEHLEVVPTPGREDLSTKRGLEPGPVLGCALEIVLVESQLGASFSWVPGEHCCIVVLVRVS